MLKPDYPHESASNSLFNVKKGEVLECPPGYNPSSCFRVCESPATAQQYIKTAYTENTMPSVSSEGEGRSPPPPSYPLFRKITAPDGSVTHQLFARDIHRFLARREEEVIADMAASKLQSNTVQRLLDYERKHFSRQSVIKLLEPIANPKSEEKKDSKEKGITTSKSLRA